MSIAYKVYQNILGDISSIAKDDGSNPTQYIPFDVGNSDYVQFLQYLAENGDSDVTGEPVPASIQKDADDWLFNKQLNEYVAASSRLSKYILSEGRVEIREDVVVGTKQVLNEETNEMETVNITENQITQTAIEALDATVDVTTTDMETGAQTTETVKNPLIVKDEEQRAAAQAVVDATPQPVIDSLNN
jgi:prolyl oligopeptidase PreP (S9A serine peptidase family)